MSGVFPFRIIRAGRPDCFRPPRCLLYVVALTSLFYHGGGNAAMTKQELDQHLELRRKLAKDLELLAALETAVSPRAGRLDGMPHTHSPGDPVGRLAVEIADMKDTVAQREAEVTRSEESVAAYISRIKDSQTRMIFRLRFLHGMTWGEVSDAIGGGNSEDNVKKACYRYMARGDPARMGRPPKSKGGLIDRQKNSKGNRL